MVPPVEPNGASARSAPPRRPRRRDSVDPLTADLRRLHVTVWRRFVEKLEAARDALSHAKPHASTEEVLEAALDALLAARARKRGVVEKPRTAPAADTAARAANEAMAAGAPPRSRHVPAAVRRAVWLRDGGRCQYPLACGGICGSTHRLELDHFVPWAQGGASTIDNLRVVCRGHNDLAARRSYGDLFMDAFTGGGRSAASPGSSG